LEAAGKLDLLQRRARRDGKSVIATGLLDFLWRGFAQVYPDDLSARFVFGQQVVSPPVLTHETPSPLQAKGRAGPVYQTSAP